jgi:hypothetical protein
MKRYAALARAEPFTAVLLKWLLAMFAGRAGLCGRRRRYKDCGSIAPRRGCAIRQHVGHLQVFLIAPRSLPRTLGFLYAQAFPEKGCQPKLAAKLEKT